MDHLKATPDSTALGSTTSMETDGICGAIPLIALLAARGASDAEFEEVVLGAVTVLSARPENVHFAMAAARLLRDAIRLPGDADTSAFVREYVERADGGAPVVSTAIAQVKTALPRPYIEVAQCIYYQCICDNDH